MMTVFTCLTLGSNQLADTAKPPTICLDGDADIGAESSVSPNNTGTDGVEDLGDAEVREFGFGCRRSMLW